MAHERQSVGYGLIGCGGFGRFCLNAIQPLTKVQAVAVADTVRAAAEGVGEDFSLPAYDDPKEMIARDDVDVVHIATPPSSHHELAMAALQAGKHVLCEKPLAISVDQGREMIDAARNAGRICPVNFVLRYNIVTDMVKRIIDSGVLGRVLSARLTNCAQDTGLPADHWFWDKDVSGGIFIEHGVHFFDLYRYWLGEGQVVSSHTETRQPTGQEDRVTCVVRHESGAIVSHYHAFDQLDVMDRTDHRLVCELGDIIVQGWIPLTVQIDAAVDDQGLQTLQRCCPDADISIVREFGDTHTTSRGADRHVTKRIELTATPDADKQKVYAHSVEALLADQIEAVANPDHTRVVDERNGLAAMELAESSAKTAR